MKNLRKLLEFMGLSWKTWKMLLDIHIVVSVGV